MSTSRSRIPRSLSLSTSQHALREASWVTVRGQSTTAPHVRSTPKQSEANIHTSIINPILKAFGKSGVGTQSSHVFSHPLFICQFSTWPRKQHQKLFCTIRSISSSARARLSKAPATDTTCCAKPMSCSMQFFTCKVICKDQKSVKCEYQREWTVFSGHKHTSAYCQNLGLDPATNPKLERGVGHIRQFARGCMDGLVCTVCTTKRRR